MFTPAESVNIDRVAQFAIAAATEALGASRLDLDAANRDRIGVYWGTGMGGAQTLDASFHRLYADKDARVRPLTVVMAMSNAAGSNVALRYGLRGPFAN
jgi:3-oxoacyl-[acyl-carrier-protein] synthase II